GTPQGGMRGSHVGNGRSKGGGVVHPETPERALPEMVLGCVLGAMLAALEDVTHVVTTDAGVRASAGEITIAALDLVAFVLPVGLVLGIVLGLVLALVRASPH